MEQSLEEMRAPQVLKSMMNGIIVDDNPDRALTGEPYRAPTGELYRCNNKHSNVINSVVTKHKSKNKST
jgi:hypothetical protein